MYYYYYYYFIILVFSLLKHFTVMVMLRVLYHHHRITTTTATTLNLAMILFIRNVLLLLLLLLLLLAWNTFSITTLTHPYFNELSTLVTKPWFLQTVLHHACPFTLQLSRDVLADAGFLCGTAVMFRDQAEETACLNQFMQFITILCQRSGPVQSNLLWHMGHFKIFKHCAGQI